MNNVSYMQDHDPKHPIKVHMWAGILASPNQTTHLSWGIWVELIAEIKAFRTAVDTQKFKIYIQMQRINRTWWKKGFLISSYVSNWWTRPMSITNSALLLATIAMPIDRLCAFWSCMPPQPPNFIPHQIPSYVGCNYIVSTFSGSWPQHLDVREV